MDKLNNFMIIVKINTDFQSILSSVSRLVTDRSTNSILSILGS